MYKQLISNAVVLAGSLFFYIAFPGIYGAVLSPILPVMLSSYFCKIKISILTIELLLLYCVAPIMILIWIGHSVNFSNPLFYLVKNFDILPALIKYILPVLNGLITASIMNKLKWDSP